jgi:hypothetical protein
MACLNDALEHDQSGYAVVLEQAAEQCPNGDRRALSGPIFDGSAEPADRP